MKFVTDIFAKSGLIVDGSVTLNTTPNANVDTDKFLVQDGLVVKYRTGAEVLSDIGAQGALTLTVIGNSGPSTLIGNGLNIPTYTLSGLGGVPSTRTINGLALSSDQTFATGTTGTDFNIVSAGTVHTFNIPDADPVNRGFITPGTQTIGGAKTFASPPTVPSLYLANMGAGSGVLYYDLPDNRVTLANYNVGGEIKFEVNGGNYTMTLNSDLTIELMGYTTNGFVKTSGGNGLLVIDTTTYTPTSTTLTINGTSFNLSANRTWNVGTVTSVGLTAPTGFSVSNSPVTSSGTIALNFASGYSLPTDASQTNWDTAYNNRITSLTTTGTSGAATLISHVLNIPQYQAQGNYITALTGEATASGPGSASVTLTNSAVIGKVLTGLSVTSGSIVATDSILQAFGKVQGQINALSGGLIFQGTWNANTNSPTITSGVGSLGYFYIVNVAGNTTIDGNTGWQVGDWILFDGTAWQKVDNTDAVTSVNGQTGAVVLTTTNISEGTNLYYTDARARQAISLTTTGSSGAATYSTVTGILNVPNYTLSGLGGVPSSRTLTINGTALDLSADRSWSVGTVTSVAASGPLFISGSATVTPIINISQANTTTSGFLSSTDWNTFNNKQNAITLTTTGSSGSATLVGATLNIPSYTLSGLGGVPTSTTLTINGTSFDLSTNRTWSVGTVTSITFSGPLTGGTITGSGTVGITQASGSASGFLSSTDWSTFNSKQNAITLTTTGSSGAATFVGATLNIPNYTLSGLGGVPTSRTLTINGTTYDLTADRSWTISAGVSSVSGSGTGISVSPTTGAVVVSNTGVTSNVAGTGISVSGATGAVTITNTGVTSNVAGTGISVSGATGAITITNTGVTSIVAGTGISISGATGAVTVTNAGVTSVNGGTGAITGIITTSNYNSYSPTLTGGGASGTWSINITGSAGSASSASSVPWTGVSSCTRTNYDLGFATPDGSSSYAGFYFSTPGSGGSGNAGYFLVRGGADNDVYTQNGITLVADAGWLTLAQRTQSNKGVRIMTGSASTTRIEIVSSGMTTVNSGLTVLSGLAWNDATPALNVGGSGDARIQVRHIWGKSASTSGVDHLWLNYANTGRHVQVGDSGGGNDLYVSGNIYMNGYFTGNLVATQSWVTSQGYITGNQTITLSGDASGSGTTSISVTVNQIDGWSFVNTGSNSGTAADSINSNGISYVSANISLFGQTDGALYSQAYSSSWQHQVYGDYRTGQITIRGKNSGTWQSWRTVLDSSNYTSYAPSLTGSGASGTWGINITGNSVTTSQTNFSSLTISGAAVATQSWVSSQGYVTGGPFVQNVLGDSGAYNLNTSGQQAFFRFSTGAWVNGPTTGNYSHVLSVNGATDNRTVQIYLGDVPGYLWWRPNQGGTWHGWERILTSYNYNGWVPTLTGGGASGTWSINITGNAGYASSAGNADTVDGYHASTSTIGNYIVVRDGSGYIFGNYINMTDDGNPGGGTSISSFITKQGDNYYRSVSPTNAMASIRGVASGSWSINITGSASSSTTAAYLPTLYAGGVQSNPQVYFGQSVGLRVAMTGVPFAWCDTLWINGYSGGDVLSMCALHTARNTQPRMWISAQNSNGSTYGTTYEFVTEWNSPYALNMNQYVRTTDSVTFATLSVTGATYLPNNALLSINGESDVWGARFRTTTSTTNLGGQLKNIIWCGGGSLEGLAVTGSGTGGAAFEVRNDGVVWAKADMRAPIFYDSQNTAYFCDPASTSNLSAITTGGAGTYNLFQTWTQLNGYHGFYSSLNGSHFYPNDGTYGSWRISGSRNGWGGIEFTNGSNGAITLMISNGSNESGFHNNSYGWQIFWSGGALYSGRNTYGGNHSRVLQEDTWISSKYFGSDGYIYGVRFSDSNDSSYFLDPNGTSELNSITTGTRARWGQPRIWTNRQAYSSDQNYWTGTNGWGTSEGNWANAWKGGFSGWDIWGTSTDHPQGSGYIHAQGIVSGQHYAASDGSSGYGWMMVGAGDATANRYWLRGKWGSTTSGWVEMITSGNIGSQNVNYASQAGTASFAASAGNTSSISSATGGSYTWTGQQYFQSNLGGYCGSLSGPPLQAYSTSNNSAFFSFHKSGQYAVNMGLDADSVLRIGGWSAAANRWQLDMSGNMTVAGDVTAYSDARVKENVETVEDALDKVLNLRGVYYNRTDSDDKRRKVGVIAQEILEVIPEVVGQDNDGMYNVSYGNIVGVLIEAIKEQQKQIDELKARLD